MPSVIESKVYASTLGSGAGVVVGSFLLWVLGVTLWHSSSDAGQAAAAVSSVPVPVSGLVELALAAGGAFLTGYRAPHSDRPDLAEPAQATPAADAPPSVEPYPPHDPPSGSSALPQAAATEPVPDPAAPVTPTP